MGDISVGPIRLLLNMIIIVFLIQNLSIFALDIMFLHNQPAAIESTWQNNSRHTPDSANNNSILAFVLFTRYYFYYYYYYEIKFINSMECA